MNLIGGCCQIYGGEPYTVSLDDNRFIERLPNRWMQEQSLSAIRQGVAAADLGAQIGVDLIEVPAAQRFLTIPSAGQNRVEFRVDYNPATRRVMVQDHIGPHHWQDLVYTCGPLFDLPSERTATLNLPSFRAQHDIEEPTNSSLVKPTHPPLFSIRQRKDIFAGHLGRKSEVEAALGS